MRLDILGGRVPARLSGMKPIRLSLIVLLAGLGVWIGRLLAHSKVPPPEGRWREIDPGDLSSTA